MVGSLKDQKDGLWIKWYLLTSNITTLHEQHRTIVKNCRIGESQTVSLDSFFHSGRINSETSLCKSTKCRMTFPNGKCAFHLLISTSPRPLSLNRTTTNSVSTTFWDVCVNGTCVPLGSCDVFHLPQPSTNRFF